MSPTDQDAYFGEPDLFTPEYDEIHISVTFTWDTKRAWELAWQWEHIAPVKIGGIAINGEPTNGFKAGIYLKNGITITSRGCPNRCPFCLVNQNLIELEDFPEGNIVQDNNFLACSRKHREKVFNMLRKQKRINFSGGLEAKLIDDEVIDQLRNLNIYQIWTAYDFPKDTKFTELAIKKLRKYFNRNQTRCYVLIGFNNDNFSYAEERLRRIYEIGGLVFAMLYRDENGAYPKPEKEWRRFQRKWTRPAIIKSMMQNK